MLSSSSTNAISRQVSLNLSTKINMFVLMCQFFRVNKVRLKVSIEGTLHRKKYAHEENGCITCNFC